MLSKKPSNNFSSNIKSPTLLILIPACLSSHRETIKEQTRGILQIFSIIHSLLMKRVIKERPRWRYLGNMKTIKIPFPVGRFIFFNHQTLTHKILKLPWALLIFPDKVKEHPKETSSLVLLLKQA